MCMDLRARELLQCIRCSNSSSAGIMGILRVSAECFHCIQHRGPKGFVYVWLDVVQMSFIMIHTSVKHIQQPIVVLFVVECFVGIVAHRVISLPIWGKLVFRSDKYVLDLFSFYHSNHICSALQQYWEVTSDCFFSIRGKKNCSIRLFVLTPHLRYVSSMNKKPSYPKIKES